LPIPDDEKFYKIIKKRLQAPQGKFNLFSCRFSCLHRFYIEQQQQQQQHNKIPRPKDYRKRKAYCSVNKKGYAEKKQIMTTSNNDLIIHKLGYNK